MTISPASSPPQEVSEALVVFNDGSAVKQARARGSDAADLLLRYAPPRVAAGVAIFGLRAGARLLLDQCMQVGSCDRQLLSAEEQRLRLGPELEDVVRELELDWSELSQRTSSLAASFDEASLSEEVRRLQSWCDHAGNAVSSLERRSALAFLGLAPDAEQEAVNKSYKQKALSVHPDKGGSEEDFQELQAMLARIQVETDEVDCAGQGGGLFGMNNLMKRCKEAQQKEKAEDKEEVLTELAKLQRSRLALHDQALELWRRTTEAEDQLKAKCQLAGRFSQTTAAGGSPPVLDSLRSFIDGFALEISAMSPGAVSAERMFCKFVRQGIEVLTASALADSCGCVSMVALNFTGPLLRVAKRSGPCPSLEQRCQALLKCLAEVPKDFFFFLDSFREKAKAELCEGGSAVTTRPPTTEPENTCPTPERFDPFAAAVASATGEPPEVFAPPRRPAPVQAVCVKAPRETSLQTTRPANQAYQDSPEWGKLRAFCIKSGYCVNFNRDAADIRCTCSAGECNFRHACAVCGAEEKGGPKAQYQSHGGWNCLQLQAWLMAHRSSKE